MTGAPDLALLVFSMDRAAQADLLLRSLVKFLHLERDVHLLYRASDAAHARGYERLLAEHPGVRPLREEEHALDDALRGLLATSPRRLFGMLVDDDVLIRAVRPEDEPLRRLLEDRRVATASLRLSPGKTWSQPLGCALRVPRPRAPGLVDLDPRRPLALRGARNLLRALRLVPRAHRNPGCWGVPFSVDGNLFLRERLRAFCERLPPFGHVTSLEPALCKQRRRWDGPLWCSFYEEERLVNLVMNNVDSQGERYPHPGHDLARMNERYLAGERLDGSAFEGARYPACHVEAAPAWRPA